MAVADEQRRLPVLRRHLPSRSGRASSMRGRPSLSVLVAGMGSPLPSSELTKRQRRSPAFQMRDVAGDGSCSILDLDPSFVRPPHPPSSRGELRQGSPSSTRAPPSGGLVRLRVRFAGHAEKIAAGCCTAAFASRRPTGCIHELKVQTRWMMGRGQSRSPTASSPVLSCRQSSPVLSSLDGIHRSAGWVCADGRIGSALERRVCWLHGKIAAQALHLGALHPRAEGESDAS